MHTFWPCGALWIGSPHVLGLSLGHRHLGRFLSSSSCSCSCCWCFLSWEGEEGNQAQTRMMEWKHVVTLSFFSETAETGKSRAKWFGACLGKWQSANVFRICVGCHSCQHWQRPIAVKAAREIFEFSVFAFLFFWLFVRGVLTVVCVCCFFLFSPPPAFLFFSPFSFFSFFDEVKIQTLSPSFTSNPSSSPSTKPPPRSTLPSSHLKQPLFWCLNIAQNTPSPLLSL